MRRGLLLGCLVFLAGCAGLPVPEQRAQSATSDAFVLDGRVAVRYDGDGHSAGVRWHHAPESDEVLLLNPLGQTAARVYRDREGAVLEDGSSARRATDVAALMQEVLGWQLPLDGLQRWVLGQTAPGDWQAMERDTAGRLVYLRQGGWDVRYLDFSGSGADSLPRRMKLDSGSLQVTLLIDRWHWGAP